MGESKYRKFLLIGLIVLIIIALGTLTFFIVDYIKTSNDKKAASDAAREGETITIESKSDRNKNTVEEEVIGLNVQPENLIMAGGTTTSGDDVVLYKGFPRSGTIRIPKIDLNIPVLSDASAKSIDVSVAINGGPGINKVGNTIIIGHNYRDGRFFANLKNVALGDKIYLTDNHGNTVEYAIYNIYTTNPEDSDFMERETNGAREITLDTCTDDTQSRLIVWAKEV